MMGSRYAFRMAFEEFYDRYKIVSKSTWPNKMADNCREGCLTIVLEQSFGTDSNEFSMGRSKAFIRSPKSLLLLEESRRKASLRWWIKIQATWRGFVQRRRYQQMRNAQITIAAWVRCLMARRAFLKRKAKLLTLLPALRMWAERSFYLDQRRHLPEHAAKTILPLLVNHRSTQTPAAAPPRTTPFPEEASILGVIYGVLLWADMNAATPLGARGRSAISLAGVACGYDTNTMPL